MRSEPLNLNKNDVVLLPLCSDSMKKLKALLVDIATVLCFEVPSDKKDLLLQKRFENEIKIWYDYVDSPSNCNSGIIMNEYHNLSEINIKNHASGAESLNNKYVCIYVKDLVSSVVTT